MQKIKTPLNTLMQHLLLVLLAMLTLIATAKV